MREPLTIAAALLAGGCTFGTLKTGDCLSRYSEGMAIAVAEARQAGSVASESYDYCLDGRRRADSMLQVLQAAALRPKDRTSTSRCPAAGACRQAVRQSPVGSTRRSRSRPFALSAIPRAPS